MINCKLNGKETIALWDTGSQISIISSDFLKRHFPCMQSQSLEEILGTSLELRAVNNSPIPYSGFVELGFELIAPHESDNSLRLNVPFLILDCTGQFPLSRFGRANGRLASLGDMLARTRTAAATLLRKGLG